MNLGLSAAAIKYMLSRLNLSMIVFTLALQAVGIAFIYSAGYGNPDAYAQQLYLRQIYWVILGWVVFFFFAFADYHRWIQSAWWLYTLGLILLALVFVPHIGLKVYGARRWIQLAHMRIMQPAELMKLALIIVLARLYGWPGRNLRRAHMIPAGLALIALPMLLIIKQPDLGSALVLLPILFLIMFAAGMPLRRLAVCLGLLCLAGGIMLGIIIFPPKLGMDRQQHEQLIRRFGINAYQRDRIEVFCNRDLDPLGAGWNKAQSKIAVGSGRVWGKGYLRGTQNMLGFLPRTVAPNDFIFSVIAEEKGFIGSMLTLSIFGGLIMAILRTVEVSADKTGRLLCIGAVGMLFCHIFVNIAMTIGLLPITGLPLPLLSYGGTFMISTMTSLGIAQSVHIRGEWR